MQITENNFLEYLKQNEKCFSISYINDVILNLPSKRLTRFIKQEKYYDTLGDYEDKVIAYFKTLGFNHEQSYSQFL